MKKYLGFAGLLLTSLVLPSCGNESISSNEISSNTTESDSSSSIEVKTDIPKTGGTFEYNNYSDTYGTDYNKDMWYRNANKVGLPDPSVYYDEESGVFYIYGTTDRTGAKTFDCYKTTNFTDFELIQNVYAPDSSSYLAGALFAPEVYKFNNKYYLYYSGDHNYGTETWRHLGVLTSDSPEGPFTPYVGKDYYGNDVDYYNNAWVKDKEREKIGILDQTIFKDDDGSYYLYYSVYDTGVMQYIVGLKMLDPVTVDYSTYKILVRPGEVNTKTTISNILSWECYKTFKVAEGPFMLKSPVNGKYYLTYSVNHYPDRAYTVCYAVSDEALGDFVKPYSKGGYWTNLMFGYAGGPTGTVYDQWEGFASGTAHHCFFKAGDEWFIGYHKHKNGKNSDNGRTFGCDHVYFDKETGIPFATGPSNSLVAIPSVTSGVSNLASEATISVVNIENKERLVDNYIVEHYNLKQESDKEVTIPEGISYVQFDFKEKIKLNGIGVYNSAFYDKYLTNIDTIYIDDSHIIRGEVFNEQEYVKFEKDFIYPCSGFNFDFDEISTNSIVIKFDSEREASINEIQLFGRK